MEPTTYIETLITKWTLHRVSNASAIASLLFQCNSKQFRVIARKGILIGTPNSTLLETN